MNINVIVTFYDGVLVVVDDIDVLYADGEICFASIFSSSHLDDDFYFYHEGE